MENTVTLSLERFKELERKEKILKCSNKCTFIVNYDEYDNPVYYGIITKDEAIKSAEDTNKKLNELIIGLFNTIDSLKKNLEIERSKKKSWSIL